MDISKFSSEYLLFWLYASIIAPFHFSPKACPVPDKHKCDIWNCNHHYFDNKYSKCQLYLSDEDPFNA